MNATFPFLSPAVSLPTKNARRVVDAGYYDNTGVSVAAAWLYQYADWIVDNCSGVVVIQIRDFSSHQENRHISLPASDGRPFLPGLMSVVSAMAASSLIGSLSSRVSISSPCCSMRSVVPRKR